MPDTAELLRRIERLNPKLNAFVAVTAEPALRVARQAEKEIGAGRVAVPPMKPVTFGVLFTKCQVSSVISISTRT